jgi:flagellar L-ring protein precursor FlgH
MLRLAVFLCLATAAVPVFGQDNSLLGRFNQQPMASQLEAMSWTHLPTPQPRKVVKWDIVMVTVNEMSQVTSEGEVQRRRNSLYDAVLNDWVVMDAFRAIRPAPQTNGDPRVQGQVTQLVRSQGDLETREQISLTLAARVADIRPNGHLVLEAHKTVRNNNEVWEVSLSGECRPEDVNQNNMILSERIYGLEIHKREMGQIRESYKRGAVTRFLDRFNPF